MSTDSPRTIPGLAELFSDISVQEFRTSYWQKQALYGAAQVSDFAGLREDLFDFDIERILRSVPRLQDIVLHPRVEFRVAPSKDLGSLLALYDHGCQLYVPCSHIAALEEWLIGLNRDVGRLVHSAGLTDVFATKRGGGIEQHFDQNDNFTIQLVGRKKWTYSATPGAINPLRNSGESADSELSERRPGGDELHTVLLSPGDTFYIPRGHWHGTEALDDSLSLNLNLGPSSWSEILRGALHNLMVQRPAWRRSATNSPSELSERLAELSSLVSSLPASDLLVDPSQRRQSSTVIGEQSLLRRNSLVWWYVAQRDGKSLKVMIEFPPDITSGFALPARFEKAMSWLTPDRSHFTAEELAQAVGLPTSDALALAKVLTRAGMLELE